MISRILMDGEKQRYYVMARDDRFVIMTKPFNAKKTYTYTIADMDLGIRGPCDLIFGPPAELDTTEGAKVALQMLRAGEMGVSRRRCLHLSPSEIEQLRQRLPHPDKDM